MCLQASGKPESTGAGVAGGCTVRTLCGPTRTWSFCESSIASCWSRSRRKKTCKNPLDVVSGLQLVNLVLARIEFFPPSEAMRECRFCGSTLGHAPIARIGRVRKKRGDFRVTAAWQNWQTTNNYGLLHGKVTALNRASAVGQLVDCSGIRKEQVITVHYPAVVIFV